MNYITFCGYDINWKWIRKQIQWHPKILKKTYSGNSQRSNPLWRAGMQKNPPKNKNQRQWRQCVSMQDRNKVCHKHHLTKSKMAPSMQALAANQIHTRPLACCQSNWETRVCACHLLPRHSTSRGGWLTRQRTHRRCDAPTHWWNG